MSKYIPFPPLYLETLNWDAVQAVDPALYPDLEAIELVDMPIMPHKPEAPRTRMIKLAIESIELARKTGLNPELVLNGFKGTNLSAFFPQFDAVLSEGANNQLTAKQQLQWLHQLLIQDQFDQLWAGD